MALPADRARLVSPFRARPRDSRGLSLGASRDGAAACQALPQQLVACKRTCPVGARHGGTAGRPAPSGAPATAPGSPSGRSPTCSPVPQDPQDFFSIAQKLVVRRGNCDPVTVMEVGPRLRCSIQSCRYYGGYRIGDASQMLAFSSAWRCCRMAPGDLRDDGPALAGSSRHAKPPEEGIFFVRPDGSSSGGSGCQPLSIWITVADRTPPLE